MKNVCVIGSCVSDVIIHVPALPKRAQDINADKQVMRIGGCAYNIAHMLSLYEIPFTLFSPIGQGVYGDFVYEQLKQEGIKTIIPRITKDNGCCYCLVEADGERSFISLHGAEYKFKKEWFSLLDESQFDSVYVCGIELEEQEGHVIVDFLEQCSIENIYFAPGPRFQNIEPNLLKRMFALSPILHINEDEALRISNLDTYQEAAELIHKLTNNIVIITLGVRGTFIKSNHETSYVPGYSAKVKDTIGAGDAHLGAFIAECKLQHSLTNAIQHANVLAAAVVEVEGSSLTLQEFKKAHIPDKD